MVYDLDYIFCKIHHKLKVQGTLPHRTTFTPYKEIFTATYQYSLTFTCLINFRSIKQCISGYRPSCSCKYYSHNINHTGTVLSKWPWTCQHDLAYTSWLLGQKQTLCEVSAFNASFCYIEWTHIICFLAKNLGAYQITLCQDHGSQGHGIFIFRSHLLCNHFQLQHMARNGIRIFFLKVTLNLSERFMVKVLIN